MKTCSKCKASLPASDFWREKRRHDGLQTSCKICQKKASAIFAKANPTYFSEHSKKAYLTKYRHENKERYIKYQVSYIARRRADLQTVNGRLYAIFSSAKMRATRSQIPFDITFEWVLDQYKSNEGLCAVTGIELTTAINGPGVRFFHPYNPSLDQIVAGKGYTESNTRLVCVVVNLALNNFGDDVFHTMCSSYIAKQGKSDASKTCDWMRHGLDQALS